MSTRLSFRLWVSTSAPMGVHVCADVHSFEFQAMGVHVCATSAMIEGIIVKHETKRLVGRISG